MFKELAMQELIEGLHQPEQVAGLPGNTAARVLDTVDCSVLTVKPDGFVSPVALKFSAGR